MVDRKSRVQRNCEEGLGYPVWGLSSLDSWKEKGRIFRRMTRGWATNVIAEINRQKQSLLARYNCLGMESESRILDDSEREMMKDLAREIE
jgi:hypothetical protein